MKDLTTNKTGRSARSSTSRGRILELEAAILRRDQLLDGIAQATRFLTTGPEIGVAIREALQRLGVAVEVDRVSIFENRREATSDSLFASLRYEWSGPDAASGMLDVRFQDMPYRGLLSRWHELFMARMPVVGITQDFPDDERPLMEALGVRSLLALPIFAETFLGFIRFDDCHCAQAWSASEVAALTAMAATFGGAMLRSKAIDALQRSEMRYRTLAANLPGSAVLMFDADARIMLAEGPELEARGFDRAELVGKQISDLLDKDLLAWLEPHVHSVATGRTTSGEIPYQDNLYLFQGAPLKNENAAVYGGIAVFQNITARKHAEEVLLRMSRMEATATLAGGIAHDFNNLMVGVLGNAELLRTDCSGNAETVEMLSDIVDSARRAGDLAQLMLAYARGGKYQTREVSLNNVVREALRLHAHAFRPGAYLDERLARGLWSVMADPTQMHQVVANLCINAAEAIPDDGHVMVSTRNLPLEEPLDDPPVRIPPGRYVLLTVEDTGPGIPPETLARIFEPFFTTKFHGRGLGLAAVHGIVSNHDGFITVQTKPNEGTSFRVYLPACDREVPVRPPEMLEIPRGTETILAIDDEESVIQLTRRTLERLGYTVLAARHGLEAIQIARSYDGELHAAILDLGMPVMSGFDAYPFLREARPDMRIIICTGYDVDTAARQMFEGRACTFVRKPFTQESLGRLLRQVLDRTEPTVT